MVVHLPLTHLELTRQGLVFTRALDVVEPPLPFVVLGALFGHLAFELVLLLAELVGLGVHLSQLRARNFELVLELLNSRRDRLGALDHLLGFGVDLLKLVKGEDGFAHSRRLLVEKVFLGPPGFEPGTNRL